MDIEAAEEILARIETLPAQVKPEDCLRLFRAVADLRFTNWDYVEMLWTPGRRKAVDQAAARLYAHLVELVDRDRQSILDRLERGISDRVAFIGRNLNRPHYREYDVEFFSEVLFPYVDLEYVSLLLSSMDLGLSVGTRTLLDQLDGSMKQSLPNIARAFREAGYPIDPVEPRIFPDSFWWARLQKE